MISQRRVSTTQAIKQNRLSSIALAAQKVAFKSKGGKVAKYPTTFSKTLSNKLVYSIAVSNNV